MLSGHDIDGDLREIVQALADSGSCEDFWDIEMELLARGHSPAAARRAMADDEMRASLNQRCYAALRKSA